MRGIAILVLALGVPPPQAESAADAIAYAGHTKVIELR